MADEPMRALTLRQPWAGCVAHLGKRTENRSRRLPGKYAGTPIAIHAGAAVEHGRTLFVPPDSGFEGLFATDAEWDAWRFWSLGRKPRDVASWPPKLALSAVVAIATPVGCHAWSWEDLCGPQHEDSSPSTPGLCSPWVRLGVSWHWELADVRPLPEPVPCHPGKLGFWKLPAGVEKAVRDQLEEVPDAG